MYGWNGDSESESFNLVRDTLYCGNEEAYQISTGIAASSADLGKLLEVGLTKIAGKKAAKSAAKEAAESAIKKGVKQGTKDAIEDVAENSVDDLLNSTEDFYDDIFDPYYKEQFNPIGEEAIGNPDGIEGIGKSGTNSINSLDDLLTNPNKLSGVSGEELYNYLVKNGYDVKPLNRGSFKGIPFEEGGGFKVN